MAESELVQPIVNKVAVEAGTAVIMMLRDTDAGPRSAANTAIPRESQRQTHDGPALEKPSFKGNTQDKYVELINF